MKLRLLLFLCVITFNGFAQNNVLVFQSDFGLKDGAVSAMKGVAMGVSTDIIIFDVTHEIPAYNIWEAAYRLSQTAQYYPAGTVFVSVCDPGVGTSRHSIVLLTKSGHYFVTPDNGTLTLIAEQLGIQEIREIDEVKNRRQNSNESYTFHGRDVYAFTGARLASKTITFEEVGPKLPNEIVKIDYQKPVFEKGIIKGGIPILDIQYGNIWTNIDKKTFANLNLKAGDLVKIQIFNGTKKAYEGKLKLVNTFGEVAIGTNVCYFNSLLNFSLAVNQYSFSEKYKIYSGADWTILLSK
ncbi:S-adenosyl-l-methionine hydroxide adenosyltransferase family protein [Flavobacterium psychroterrae]|uniref:S-adenosyl-l-methionine hydroxide adenosyltransferase family protein n=1 Tax=Flavobacterium psychroterrae TaxID=2133767 RepID=A0ABS5PF26_9FLAO|nr:S-adenosyl-l-methionine hydroxide adenosyltransferase family protein [Flavobacterium psychroterrae]MBS7232871.1 S-adenosyl-l-methionine hydroxide adenosyltransferase family protein [Flavobacterium psychroterrae]